MNNVIYVLNGLYLDFRKKYSEAMRSYLKSGLDYGFINFRIGECFFKQKKLAEAESYYQQAITQGFKKAICFYRMGLIYEKEKQKSLAAKYFLMAIEKRPGWLPWVEHFLAVNPDLELLTEEQSKLLGNKAARSWHSLAEVRIKSAKYIQAIPYLEKSLSMQPNNAQWLFEYGYCEYKLQHHVNAIEFFKKALAQKYNKAEIFYYLYVSYQKLNDPQNSDKYLKELAKYSKINIDYGSAEFDRTVGDWLHAQSEVGKYLEKFPSKDCDAHYLAALCFDFLLNFGAARKHLQLSIALDKKIENFKFIRLAFVNLQQKRYEEACTCFRKSLSIKEDFDIRFYLGYSLYKCRKFKEAASAFSKLQFGFDLDPIDLEQKIQTCLYRDFDQNIAWQIGEIYRQKEDYQNACEFYMRMKQRLNIQSYKISEKQFENNDQFRLNCFYLSYLEYPIQEKAILYESFLANTMSCNPYALFESIYEDEKYIEFTHVWVINDMETVPPKWKNAKRVIFIKRNSDAYVKCLATCKYLINNVTFPYWFIKRPDQIYCNTWHGTPIKALGINNKFASFDYGNATRNFLQADFLIQPNEYTRRIMLRDYQIEGIVDERTYVTGYPRTDSCKPDSIRRQQLREELFGKNSQKQIILYAPTWRDYEDLEKQQERTQRVLSQLKRLEKEKYYVIFKGHQFIEKGLARKGLLSIPRWLDTNELLGVIDILITDYSSIGIDFLCTRKPVIYLIEDFAEYNKGRGLYLKENELPGLVCKDAADLPEIITSCESEFTKVNVNNALYYYDNGDCCNKVKSLIFEREKSSSREDIEVDNRVLIYPGSLLRNGILSAFLSLLKEISRQKKVYVLLDSNICKKQDNDEIIEQIRKYAKILPRVGGLIIDTKENFIKNGWSIYNKIPNKNFLTCIESIYRREGYRLFGYNYFDVFINYEGYNLEFSSILAFSNNARKKVILCHNDMFSEMSGKYPYLSRIFEEYQFYTKVLSVSNETNLLNSSNISRRFDIPIAKFDFINNIIDTENILLKANQKIDPKFANLFVDGKTFINVARLSIEKDHEKLIRAFSDVAKFDKAARLLILGQGYLQLKLMHLIERLELKHNVFMLGYIPNPYVFINRADCLVLSSNYEGQPVVLQEALTMNKPIIATDIVSTRVLLANTGAKLVANNQKAFSDAMIEYLKNGMIKTRFDFKIYNKNSLNDFSNKVFSNE